MFHEWMNKCRLAFLDHTGQLEEQENTWECYTLDNSGQKPFYIFHIFTLQRLNALGHTYTHASRYARVLTDRDVNCTLKTRLFLSASTAGSESIWWVPWNWMWMFPNPVLGSFPKSKAGSTFLALLWWKGPQQRSLRDLRSHPSFATY